MSTKLPCKKCGVLILQTTYEKNNGLCAHCKQKDEFDARHENRDSKHLNIKSFRFWFFWVAALLCSIFILHRGIETLKTGEFALRGGGIATGSEALLFGIMFILLGIFCIGTELFMILKIKNKKG